MSQIRRPQFGISAILIFTAVIALGLGIATNYARRKAFVIATYDAQKACVTAAIGELIRELESEGFVVANNSTFQHGSGDWRTCIAITANKGGDALRCHVEVMGFVSHNSSNSPTWMSILPLTVSFEGKPLDNRLVATLSSTFNERGWRYHLNPPNHRFGCP